MDRIDILGTAFDRFDFSETVERCLDIVNSDERGYPAPVNVNILMQMRNNRAVNRFVRDASVVVADGAPLVWLARLWYRRSLPERVTGIELIEALIEKAAVRGLPVYLLGASGEVMDRLLARLREQYPELPVAGYSDGFFTETEEAQKVEDIARSGAKLLFVCMGVPRQEEFVVRNWDRLGVNLVVAGGGSFDVLSGLKQRAPEFWCKYGLEWFYRLLQDPRRYFWRYLEFYPPFVLSALLASLHRIPRRLLASGSKDFPAHDR